MQRRAAGKGSGASHEALIYDSEDQLLERLVPFVDDGLRAGEPVFVVARAETLELLRRVSTRFTDLVAGVSPSEAWWRGGPVTLQAYDEGIRALLATGARRVRVVGEPVWLAAGYRGRQWRRYEAVANSHFADVSVDILCLHDARLLSADILGDVVRTHPLVTAADHCRPLGSFVDPASFVMAAEDEVMPAPPSDGVEEHHVTTDHESALPRFRARLVGAAMGDRLDELALAFPELLRNAAIHGKPPVTVRYWTAADRRGLYCEVSDSGGGIDDPLEGYAPWNPDRVGGRGLWLARQFADDLSLRNTGSGTTATLLVLNR
jgi:anti-sigma regulatory factor (Ser/Thr protein kinase)